MEKNKLHLISFFIVVLFFFISLNVLAQEPLTLTPAPAPTIPITPISIPASGDQGCGLQIFDGASINIIACEILGTLTSSLRIAKNGNIYGVILVDTADVNASKIRIKTSSGIKALKIASGGKQGLLYDLRVSGTDNTGTFTVPAGITTVWVSMSGGGGGGGHGGGILTAADFGLLPMNKIYAGGGGGGGAYAFKSLPISVAPNNTISVVVGKGVYYGTGGSSSFGSSLTASGGGSGSDGGIAERTVSWNSSSYSFFGGTGGTGGTGTGGFGGGGGSSGGSSERDYITGGGGGPGGGVANNTLGQGASFSGRSYGTAWINNYTGGGTSSSIAGDTGKNAGAYGGGGSGGGGAYSGSSPMGTAYGGNGGRGGDGFVLVEWQ